MTTISGCSVGSGFANHLHVRLGRQNHAEAIADHDVVIPNRMGVFLICMNFFLGR